MPSEQAKNAASVLPTPTEKPFHYSYLKEFRTQQCPDFLQHKCQHHRPFTCFHWHFMNQRRRRPIRKRDGTFNYNPDIYCTKYDETTGLCPDIDECQYLHRPAGDVERRYHLRYYKTGICVHETDSRGHCVKNGPHCAFAHGPHDLRPPVYDVRELVAMQEAGGSMIAAPMLSPNPDNNNTNPPIQSIPTSIAEKDKNAVNDVEHKWQDSSYVLSNYKTDICKRPPRLCRQGYACPQYHNSRDRRRSPKKYKYRSTPCPNVKHGDEWGEPTNCEQGDGCLYCHTRTEQQFHPEIYKSTKCNDMQQTAYCPRGPFCAFAHIEQEMTSIKELEEEQSISCVGGTTMTSSQFTISLSQQLSTTITSTLSGDSSPLSIPSQSQVIGPIAKPRSNSTSSNFSSESASYMKAPGYEREDIHANLRKHLLVIENDTNLDEQEKARRKQNLLMSQNMTPGSPLASTPPTPSSLSQVSPMAQPFYPATDTVESVVGNALDDLNIDDFDVHTLDKELDNDTASIGSSGAGMGSSGAGMVSSGAAVGGVLGSSAPVNIPGSGSTNPNVNSQQISQSNSTGSSPLSQLPPPFVPQHLQQQQHQQQQLEQAAAAFMSQPNPTPPGMSQLGLHNILGSPSTSRLQHSSSGSEAQQRLHDDNKVHRWGEDSWNHNKAVVSKALSGVDNCTGPHLHMLQSLGNLENLPLLQLKQIQRQLRTDLARIDKVVYVQQALKCMLCEERNRSISVLPCQHFVLCDQCTPRDCPFCHAHISQRSTVLLPL
ncbi:RING finger protein unkempt-like [Saccoglossus kowalevskii]|uniref:RING finger protein unkempt homolog n=1 Tax=Saccoglossus kowalevskii TaxID=10224 RepID=A0ABM0GLB6_SACKO|nr:PREDICTED: RING finger protein unkempt homolog [Saccoglossus kowalevskii]